MDAFALWCWRRLLRVPWTARRSNLSILKEISPKYLLQGLILKLKLQYFGHLMRRTDSLERLWCWERLKAGREGDDKEVKSQSVSHSVMSNSLLPHELQHSRLPCPSLSPGVCLKSCPLSQWHHPTISSSLPHFFSCPQSFPASESFSMNKLFTSGD